MEYEKNFKIMLCASASLPIILHYELKWGKIFNPGLPSGQLPKKIKYNVDLSHVKIDFPPSFSLLCNVIIMVPSCKWFMFADFVIYI